MIPLRKVADKISEVRLSLALTEASVVGAVEINEVYQSCKALDTYELSSVAPSDYVTFLLDVCDIIMKCYVNYESRNYDVTSMHGVLEDMLHAVICLQNWFLAELNSNQHVKTAMFSDGICKVLCFNLVKLANAADKIDTRNSLPVWKCTSSVLKLHKNELKEVSAQINAYFSDIIYRILDSLRYYYARCLDQYQSTVGDPELSSKTVNTDLKMLNLLNRITTFIVCEFPMELLHQIKDSCESALFDWLKWMVCTFYAGGAYPFGTGIPKCLVERLDNAFFLAFSVTLNHLIGLPPTKTDSKECSLFALLLSHVDLHPLIKSRIYGKILETLVRFPHYYYRWLNDDFNLYAQLFQTCERIKFDVGKHVEEFPYSGEFYTTLLKQICASICGLSVNCFNYLETALFTYISSENLFVYCMVMDVWCFVARYGTSELCMQYVTIMANIIESSVSNRLRGGTCKQSLNIVQYNEELTKLTRLGYLLTRLIVFLTPKQQLKFLQKYPLSTQTACESMTLMRQQQLNAITPVWNFIALTVSNRLQKGSCKFVQQQITNRVQSVCDLINKQMLVDSPCLNTQLLMETCLCLHLIGCLPNLLRQNLIDSMMILIPYWLVNSGVYQNLCRAEQINFQPYSFLIHSSVYQPVTTVYQHLSIWFPNLIVNLLIDQMVSTEFSQNVNALNVLVQFVGTNEDNRPSQPANSDSTISFMLLYTWIKWFDHPFESTIDVVSRVPDCLKRFKTHIMRLESEIPDLSVNKDLLNQLSQKLAWLPDPNTDAFSADECINSGIFVDEVGVCLNQMHNIIDRLKSLRARINLEKLHNQQYKRLVDLKNQLVDLIT